jgi:hypothetical protein
MNTWLQRVGTKPNSALRNHINVCASNLRPCFKWGVGLAISVTPAKADYADYRVNAGDVVEVVVAGVPELTHRAAVQVDGNISLPLVGLLPVAGPPLRQIRANRSEYGSLWAELAKEQARMWRIKNAERIIASEDTELRPGDALEVTLRYQDCPDAPPRRLNNSSTLPFVMGRTDTTGGNSLREMASERKGATSGR